MPSSQSTHPATGGHWKATWRLAWVGLLAGLPACALPGLGRSFYKASLPSEPESIEVVVVGVQPLAAPSPTAATSPVLDPVAVWPVRETENSLPEFWSPRFQPRFEFAFDLGVGEAPYDDNDHNYELDYRPPQGFSDALVQLEWRNQMAPGLSWHGIAAMQRVQEDSLLEAMDAADWAWFGVGLQWSW